MIAGFLKGLKTNLFGSGPQRAGSGTSGPTKTDDISLTKSPISSLDSNPLRFGTYQFPKDVFENQQLGHYMVFYVNATDKSKYYYGESNPYEGMDNEEQAGFDAAGVGTTKFGFVGTKAMANRLKIARNKVTGTNSTRTGIADLAKTKRNSNALQGFSSSHKTTSRIADSIALYLPPNDIETTSASYEDTPLGVIGVAAQDIVGLVDSVKGKDFEKGAAIGYEALSVVAQEIFKNLGGGFIEALTGAEGVVCLLYTSPSPRD